MMASPDTNTTRVKGALLLVNPSRACTASGLGTLGSRGDSSIGVTAITDETVVTQASTTSAQNAHRQRGPGNRPFGKNRIVKMSKVFPSVQTLPNTKAGHTTQLRGKAPLKSPRMATKSPVRYMAPASAIASNNQPIGLLGRRIAISTPRIPMMGAPRKYANWAVTSESIALES